MKKIVFLLLFPIFSGVAVLAQNRETRKVDSFNKIAFRFAGTLYLKQGSPQSVVLEGSKDILDEIDTDVDGSRLIIGKEGKWFDWGDWNDHDKIAVYITVPDIKALSVSGSGNIVGQGKITAENLNLNVSGSGALELEMEASGDVKADVSGSGNIELKGSCESFDSDVSGSGKVSIEVAIMEEANFGVSGSGRIIASGNAESVRTSISGSGKILAADLEAKRCEVRISGSGNVEVNAKEELDATISGSGNVSYKGNPNKLNSHASGSGSLRKL